MPPQKFRGNVIEGRTITINVNKTGENSNIQKPILQNPQKVEKPNSVFAAYDIFDGEIEPTMQSMVIGDCWLLSGVNALNTTKWGKKIIKDALRPDGEGGVIVTLKGADSSQKEYRITLAEIDKAFASDRYSLGDDDMLAIELAVEKYARKHVAEGKLDKNPQTVLDGGIGRNMMYLLSGAKTHDFHPKDPYMDSALDKIFNNPHQYSAYCGFKEDSENLTKNHAYAIKEIKQDKNGNKFAVLINPQDALTPEIVPYEEFRANLRLLVVQDNPQNPDAELKSEVDVLSEEIEALKRQEEAEKND